MFEFTRKTCKLRNQRNCWHFIPTFVNLFVRWRHKLWVSQRNRSCFDLRPYYLDLWPLTSVTRLPSCQFSICYSTPFHYRLRVRPGTDRCTDRQTDRQRHQCIMRNPMGRCIINQGLRQKQLLALNKVGGDTRSVYFAKLTFPIRSGAARLWGALVQQ